MTTLVWALEKTWGFLREILEDTPVILVPLLVSIHRDCYSLLRSDPMSPAPWDPWDVTALGTLFALWILYAYLPSSLS